MTFLYLAEHCSAIAQILNAIDDAPDWQDVQERLLVAASVVSAKVDTIQHNPNYGWCCSGDEFDDARKVLIEQFVAGLTVFGLICGALESSIDIIRPQPHPDKSKRRKIGNVCNLLKKAFYVRGHVLDLEREIELFRNLAQRCIGYDSVEKRL